MKSSEFKLIGTWVSDPDDLDGRTQFGNATIEFASDGTLTHTIHESGKDQKIFLTYEVEGLTLVTDQPRSPRRERTSFSFTSDGKLELWFGGERSVYIRKDGLDHGERARS